MRNTVRIEGLELTRAQVEAAVKALDAPEIFEGGSIVIFGKTKHAVIDHSSAEPLREAYPWASKNDVWTVSLATGAIHNLNPTKLVRFK